MSIIKYYDDSLMIIQNGTEFSSLFKTTLGVRQGGIMSPKLFSIYVEELIAIIESQESGLTLNNNNKIDIIMYADDILLLSSTKYGLKTQLELVEEYGNKYEIKFDPD